MQKARTKLEVDVLGWDLLSRKDDGHHGTGKGKKYTASQLLPDQNSQALDDNLIYYPASFMAATPLMNEFPELAHLTCVSYTSLHFELTHFVQT